MSESGRESRVAVALGGSVVFPPVRGLSFVDPRILPASPGAADPASALVRACGELGLDFCFVPMGVPWEADALWLAVDTGIAGFAAVDGVFSRAVGRLGFEEVARRSLRDPAGLGHELDRALDGAESDALRAIEQGARAVVVADDLAGARGPLLDPGFIESAIVSRYAALVSHAADAGVPAVVHSDGDTRMLYGSFARAGFAAVHGDCGRPENLYASFSAAKGHGLAFMGGIPSTALTDLAAASLAGAIAATMAMAGGVLICDDGGVATSTEAAALFAALAAAGA